MGIGVDYDVFFDEFNVLLVKIVVILIVSDDFCPVRTIEFFFVRFVVAFIAVLFSWLVCDFLGTF